MEGSSPWSRGAIAGRGERSQVERSDRCWMGAILGGGEWSQVEGAIADGGGRSQVEGSNR